MAMTEDARDVLDTNGIVSQTFSGEVVGHFRRLGPNSWDDYELVEEPGGEIVVHRGNPVMVEELGAELRMRARGQVLVVRWRPTPEALAAVGEGGDALRAYFLAHYIKPHDEAPGLGAAAVIVKKLRQQDP